MTVEATFVRPSDRRVGAIMEFTTPDGEVMQRPFDVNIDTRQFVAKVDITSEPGDGPLEVQHKQGEAFSPSAMVLSFGSVPAPGHLLVAFLNTPAAITTDMAALGYSRVVGGTIGGAIYWKVAGASEPDELSITCSGSGSRLTGVWAEWEQMAASPLGVFASNPGSGDVSSKSSGTTAETAQENTLSVAMFSFGSGTAISGLSWTNGYESFAQTRNIYLGTALHGVIAQEETTLSWSGLKNMAGAVLTFKAAQAAAADPSPRQYFSRFVVLEVEAAAPLLNPADLPDFAVLATTTRPAAYDLASRPNAWSSSLRPDGIDASLRPARTFETVFEREP